MADGDKRILYKNHCTPQEQVGSTDRYYLDSDCGRKLTGNCISKSTSIGTPVVNTFSGTITLTSVKFIHVRNTDTSGSDYLLLNIGAAAMGAVIRLNYGESFSSDVGSTASDTTTVVITASGTPDYEYIKGA